MWQPFEVIIIDNRELFEKILQNQLVPVLFGFLLSFIPNKFSNRKAYIIAKNESLIHVRFMVVDLYKQSKDLPFLLLEKNIIEYENKVEKVINLQKDLEVILLKSLKEKLKNEVLEVFELILDYQLNIYAQEPENVSLREQVKDISLDYPKKLKCKIANIRRIINIETGTLKMGHKNRLKKYGYAGAKGIIL